MWVDGFADARRRRADFVRLVCAVALIGPIACSDGPPAPEAGPPNLVLITIDTLRPDRLEPYGASDIRTPSVAEFAREALLFEAATTDVTWTIPSMASVMTGQYPTTHRVRSFEDRLSESAETLAERLSARGYRTAGIVGSIPLDRRFGLAQGFRFYDDEMTVPLDSNLARDAERARQAGNAELTWLFGELATRGYRPDAVVVDRAIEWLGERGDGPYFLWVHLFGPHEKLERLPPDTPPLKRLAAVGDRAQYDADVEATDRELGRLLVALRAQPDWQETAVALHADHGQTLDEHDLPGHGFDLFDSSARVPLLLRLPGGARAGERVSREVRNLDLFRTLLVLAGDRGPDGPSQDLLAETQPRSPTDPEPHVYLETWRGVDGNPTRTLTPGAPQRGVLMRGVRTARYKLIEVRRVDRAARDAPLDDAAPREYRLFDLRVDPDEQQDIAAQSPEVVARLAELLSTHVDTGVPSARIAIDDETSEGLRAIGYVD